VRFIVSFRDVITGYLRRQRWEAAFLDKLTPGLTRPSPPSQSDGRSRLRSTSTKITAFTRKRK
jgi:hypothetical protein